MGDAITFTLAMLFLFICWVIDRIMGKPKPKDLEFTVRITKEDIDSKEDKEKFTIQIIKENRSQ